MTDPSITPEEKAATTSLGDLLTGVSKDISTLFRQEVELAKAELTESAKKAGKGAGMFGGAGLTAFFALLFLSIAAWWGLGFVLNNALSAVVIAVIYAIVALILFLRGKKELKEINGAPKTVDSLKKIPETVKPGGHA
ncbi:MULTISPECIES: phage holin family protein [unclassified Frondihabitans]|jgi:Flp pilus assembly protein TadB|uniref:phage holin family protein n=1 Tax=unclassified Frondihabitans TaxID=2626248 RepID=UPI000F517053|nr:MULTISPECIES: phage holin family protein [unclassified Frondihabitans]MBF4575670.1 phage holin family protein [Frondihabitans sp. VKM Ac-2883]RPE78273.1 putative superfamily III holin-X [Frondihabitans sp. PhB153]RPF08554.1 putative superfamily III holin-X [Frondihabitans sp. PhB161]